MSEHNFNDVEPEDIWTRGDDIPHLIINLSRRASLLDGGAVLREWDEIDEILDVLEARAKLKMLDRDLDDRSQVRAQQIVDDVVYVRSRL